MLFSRARARLHALRSNLRELATVFARSVKAGARVAWLSELERHGRRVRERAQASWATWDEEDLEAEIDGVANLTVEDAAAVDFGRFKNHGSRATVRLYEDEPVFDVGGFAEQRRHDYVQDMVLDRRFVALAQAWKKERQEARNLAQLPHDADGVHWPFAGPIMFRELWLVQYILITVLGVDPQLAAALGKRILNEWHDLEPEVGLTDDEKNLLRMEREEQRA